MSQDSGAAGHVFISYVREDAERVDRLQRLLEVEGITVWRDTSDLWPGQDWRIEIRRAIESGLAFIACFSEYTESRGVSFQNEELILATEMMRRRPPGKVWLLPVRFADCELPPFDLGAGRTLNSLQRVDFFNGTAWEPAAARLATAVRKVQGRSEARTALQPGPRYSRLSTETRRSPRRGDSASASGDEPEEPIAREYQARLSALLKEIDMRPDRLDLVSNDVHEQLIMPAYELTCREVEREHGSNWDARGRQRFRDIYSAVANKWPTYREALAELELARHNGMSINDAMMRLEGPRSGYIIALMSFYDEFSGTLDFFFP